MSKMFEMKKASLDRELQSAVQRSNVLAVLARQCTDDEYRVVVSFATQTLVRDGGGEVATAGPVVVGIRYHSHFLGEAPNPLAVATILQPQNVFHPNVNSITGTICCGHLIAAFTLQPLLHLLWAGINFRLAKAVDTRPGNIIDPEAAHWVIANAHRLPITPKGLWETP